MTAQASSAPQYAVLASPTPGRDNSGPRPGGPLIVGCGLVGDSAAEPASCGAVREQRKGVPTLPSRIVPLPHPPPPPIPSCSTTRTAAPAPGAAITVTSTVSQQTSPLASVQLYYTVGYGPEAALPMTGALDAFTALKLHCSTDAALSTDGLIAAGGATPAYMPAPAHSQPVFPPVSPAASADGTTYAATIPGAPAGSLVRWYVKAADSQGQSTRDPLFASPDDQQYYGTIVADPSDASSLPVLEL